MAMVFSSSQDYKIVIPIKSSKDVCIKWLSTLNASLLLMQSPPSKPCLWVLVPFGHCCSYQDGWKSQEPTKLSHYLQ